MIHYVDIEQLQEKKPQVYEKYKMLLLIAGSIENIRISNNKKRPEFI